MPADRRPILVTGAHRTGTTWVGRLLAAPPGHRLHQRAPECASSARRLRCEGRQLVHLHLSRQRSRVSCLPIEELLSYRYHLAG